MRRLSKYCKVPKQKSRALIELVFQLEYKIKEAAQLLTLNYATAKNIIMRFRKTKIAKKTPKSQSNRRCGFRKLGQNQISQVRIICSKAGHQL